MTDLKFIASQWLVSSCAAQLRQIVVDHGPSRPGIEVEVSIRVTIDFTVQSRKSYIHFLGMCLAEHLASANFAKSSCALFRTLENRDVLLPRGNLETLGRNPDPGHETGTMGASAH